MSYATPKYKRTVRCSYCRCEGHNKSACPKHKERVENLRAEYGSDYYVVAMYDEKQAKRRAKGADRKCSYCSEGGHNRSRCTILAEHMAQTTESNIAFRQRVFQRMVHHGLFAGTLVSNGTFYQKGEEKRFLAPMVVTRVCWENINVWETEFRYFSDTIRERPPLEIKPLHALFRSYRQHASFPYDFEMNYAKMDRAHFERYSSEDANSWYAQYKDSYFITILSKVTAQKPPIGWLSCTDKDFQKTLKEFYKKRKLDNGGVYVGRTFDAAWSE